MLEDIGIRLDRGTRDYFAVRGTDTPICHSGMGKNLAEVFEGVEGDFAVGFGGEVLCFVRILLFMI